MNAPDHKAVSGVVDIRSIHAEYVAGSIAAAWCKSDFQVRAARCREAAALIRAQAAELEKLRQRCELAEADAATERALQRAAKELPEGWIVRVEVERGAGWVDLHDPSGAFTVQGLIDADDTLAAAIYRAIDRAGGGES